MNYSLRNAVTADKELLAPWTANTFAWGDYVVDSFDAWLAHPQSLVRVAVDDQDVPIGVARGVLLSADELWIQGARVHPDWRRRGVASALGDSLQEWAADNGAKVALLMTEDWNQAARVQVAGVGFRETCTWLRAFKPTHHSGRAAPANPDHDDAAGTLQRAALTEVGPAYGAWSGSELNRAGRGMMAVIWQWRRLRLADLERAAKHGALFAGPTGWAIGAPRNQAFEVGWINTTPDRATEHFEAILAVAVTEKATTLEIMMPAVPWMEEAATALDFELEALTLYERPL